MKCGLKCEIWSRVCGYHRPLEQWNRGKKEEFNQRKNFEVSGGRVLGMTPFLSLPPEPSKKEVSK